LIEEYRFSAGISLAVFREEVSAPVDSKYAVYITRTEGLFQSLIPNCLTDFSDGSSLPHVTTLDQITQHMSQQETQLAEFNARFCSPRSNHLFAYGRGYHNLSAMLLRIESAIFCASVSTDLRGCRESASESLSSTRMVMAYSYPRLVPAR
jgi:hypothetical protein